MHLPSPSLRWLSLNDTVYCLDISSGKYKALLKGAAKAWVKWLGPRTSAHPPSSPCDPAYLDYFESCGLLNASKSNAPLTETIKIPFWLGFEIRSWLIAALLKKKVKQQRYENILTHPVIEVSGSIPLVKIMKKFRRTELLLRLGKFEQDCFYRALLLYNLLKSYGYSPLFRIGIKTAPFMAHAWVEMDGKPFLDTEDNVSRFTPMHDMPA
ncbi:MULTISPECIES: lasso peptide biosynthesis B2 protein [Deefgea]|nr:MULTISPECIES: lasso peptide biosynthesis B2 protein [Deefgea]MBM9888809.1 lasso peptide biosynthesis B2 protein [Deefgea sp. CFH1-16]